MSNLTRKGQEYVNNFTPLTPAPTQPNPVPATQNPVHITTKNHLERIPLPIFSGVKVDYLKFKQKFQDHVTNYTEKDKLMVLPSSAPIPA